MSTKSKHDPVSADNLRLLAEALGSHKAAADAMGMGYSTFSKHLMTNITPQVNANAAAYALSLRGDVAAPATGPKVLIIQIPGHDYAMVKELITRMGGRIAFTD